MDIEEIVAIGTESKMCPYYATRSASAAADVVAVPYTAILARSTREALGIDLRGSVLILDEAHNAVDAVSGAHASEMTAKQARLASGCLARYTERFASRLSAANRASLSVLLRAARALVALMERNAVAAAKETGVLIVEAGLDNVNFLRLARFVSESKVLFKVSSFVERDAGALPTAGGGKAGPGGPRPPDLAERMAEALAALQALVSFIVSLSVDSKDGRVLPLPAPAPTGGAPPASAPSHGANGLRFILLNAASEFEAVVKAARAVVFASGTLAPLESFRRQLFPSLPDERVRSFSCGHVVPDHHLLGLCVGLGPTGVELDFRSKGRSRPELVTGTAPLISNIARVVPGGTVVFFPSFAFMEAAKAQWEAAGLLSRIVSGSRGGVFWEPRAGTALEGVLADFAGAVKAHGAAVLMSVVGAKLSEGINFSDDLGRCVVVLGMPYPNPTDPEIVERMAYLDGAATESPPARFTGRDYYESMCKRALNQSIGRVIRHRGDYAAVVLADARYQRACEGAGSALDGIPQWMRPRFRAARPFGEVVRSLGQFFKGFRGSAQPGSSACDGPARP